MRQGPRDVKQNSWEGNWPQPLLDAAGLGGGQTHFGGKAGTHYGAEGPKLGHTMNLSGVMELEGLRNLGAIVGGRGRKGAWPLLVPGDGAGEGVSRQGWGGGHPPHMGGLPLLFPMCPRHRTWEQP